MYTDWSTRLKEQTSPWYSSYFDEEVCVGEMTGIKWSVEVLIGPLEDLYHSHLWIEHHATFTWQVKMTIYLPFLYLKWHWRLFVYVQIKITYGLHLCSSKKTIPLISSYSIYAENMPYNPIFIEHVPEKENKLLLLLLLLFYLNCYFLLQSLRLTTLMYIGKFLIINLTEERPITCNVIFLTVGNLRLCKMPI